MGKITLAKVFCLCFLSMMVNATAIELLHAQVVDDDKLPNAPAHPPAKITVGVVEDVILSPWNVSFAARIDTGADLSSLDARDLVVHNNIADFKLGKRWGSRQLQLPVVEWRQVQTAMGVERRPVVEIAICLGPKRFKTLATLKDRSTMMYPFLVGRSALNGAYLVDASRSRAAQPACSQLSMESGEMVTSAKD